MNTLTIFLSHSHKDIEKVHKLREILESLEFEPLIFHLQCLDDSNSELEEFIKREIDARNVFIYCRSKNSESSDWVQKELQYIKRSDSRRLYTIDIDLPLNRTLVTLLNSLCELVRQNRIFLSCSHGDAQLCDCIKELLVSNGYEVYRFEHLNTEGEQEEHDKVIREIVKNGIFMPVITHRYMKSIYCQAELESALYATDYGIKPLIVPLVVNYSLRNALRLIQRLCLYNPHAFDFDQALTDSDKSKILEWIREITKNS